MRDEPFKVCPKELCRQAKWGKGKVKRLLGTGAGLIFKGSGFYITDYRSNSYKEGAKKESPSGGKKAATKAPAQNGRKACARETKPEPKRRRTPVMTKLICPDCQHENELERIYCHNCGARLDRTGLIKEKMP